MKYSQDRVFFGSNYKVLEQVLEVTPITKIFCETKKISKELETLGFLRGIHVHAVGSLNEVRTIIDQAFQGICCGFGLIFDQDIIERFEQGIINIHYGELPNNRGRHPLSWAYLSNDFNLAVSLHQVNTEVDKGKLLSAFTVHRSLDDDLLMIEEKIYRCIPLALETAMNNLSKGHFTVLGTGHYNPSLIGYFDTFKVEEHDAAFILNAVRAQKSYGGIRVHNKYVTKAYICTHNNPGEPYFAVTSKDGIKIWLS